MKFAFLYYESPASFEIWGTEAEAAFRAAWEVYMTDLNEAGVLVGGAPLQPPATALTLHLVDGVRQVQDGPYADTKEQLGGIMILELPSLHVALGWAVRCPIARDGFGRVEIREVWMECSCKDMIGDQLGVVPSTGEVPSGRAGIRPPTSAAGIDVHAIGI